MSRNSLMDDDLLSRLKLLKTRFGIDYKLVEPELEKAAFIDPDDGSGKQATKAVAAHATPKPQQFSAEWPQPVDEEDPFVPPFDCSNLRQGECLDADVSFCSLKVVQAYPENFVGKANTPRVKPFFEKILEERVWDFFYLFHPEAPEDGSRLLVPSLQFEAFLHSINRQLGTSLTIPKGVNQDQFYLKFGQGGTPRPRYLKRTRDEKTLRVEVWPEVDKADVEAFQCATMAHQEDWKSGWSLLKPTRSSADKKKKRQLKAIQRRADHRRMLDETQQYLHLKGRCPFDVVLVCMDVEALELPPHPISEVGVSFLDVERIRNVPPGASGQDWWQFIESHHIRVKEYSGLVNYRYVQGCPSDFDFGNSTFSSKADLANNLDALLAKYVDQGRTLAFVGHEVTSDLNYLSRVGFDVFGMSYFCGQLDTKTIHQAWKGSDNGRSLEGILGELCIPSKHLHNAGNDAAFTLRALLGLAIEEIREQEAIEKGQEYVPSLFNEQY